MWIFKLIMPMNTLGYLIEIKKKKVYSSFVKFRE